MHGATVWLLNVLINELPGVLSRARNYIMMCYEELKSWARKKGRGMAEKAVEDAEWTICGFLKQGGHVQYVRGDGNVMDMPTHMWLISVPFLQKKVWVKELMRREVRLHLRFEVILDCSVSVF